MRHPGHPVPCLADWAATLSELGLAERLIVSLEDARGTHAWKVHPTDEDLLRLIVEGIKGGSLGRLNCS